MKPADYSYKRFRVELPGRPATTVAMPWLQYMSLLRYCAGDIRAFSKLTRALAAHLYVKGHQGTLSAATRVAVKTALTTKS